MLKRWCLHIYGSRNLSMYMSCRLHWQNLSRFVKVFENFQESRKLNSFGCSLPWTFCASLGDSCSKNQAEDQILSHIEQIKKLGYSGVSIARTRTENANLFQLKDRSLFELRRIRAMKTTVYLAFLFVQYGSISSAWFLKHESPCAKSYARQTSSKALQFPAWMLFISELRLKDHIEERQAQSEYIQRAWFLEILFYFCPFLKLVATSKVSLWLLFWNLS